MTDISQLTRPFAGAPDLQITLESDLFVIRKLYKYKWLYATGAIIVAAVLFGFTIMIAVMGIQENKPDYIGGVLLFLVIDIGAFYLLKGALFSREILSINLQDKTVVFQKNRKKPYKYNFDEIIQWQLLGKIFRASRGGPTVMTKLYLRLKHEPKKHKPIMMFQFFSAPQNIWKAQDMEAMKNSARERGEEVAKRLQDVTQIHWRWYEYNDKY